MKVEGGEVLGETRVEGRLRPIVMATARVRRRPKRKIPREVILRGGAAAEVGSARIDN